MIFLFHTLNFPPYSKTCPIDERCVRAAWIVKVINTSPDLCAYYLTICPYTNLLLNSQRKKKMQVFRRDVFKKDVKYVYHILRPIGEE